MRISTNEFLLGSLSAMLAQQANVNQLNQQIATGQTMLDAGADPGGASQSIRLAGQIGQLKVDSANATAATQSLQNSVSTLSQVTNVLAQLRQTAIQAANGGDNPSDRQAVVALAQGALDELVQLANTQAPNGQYLFAGTKSGAAPFMMLPSGQVVFAGDAAVNLVQISPSLNVPSTVSGQSIFMSIPAGAGGITVAAGTGNTGGAYALTRGVGNPGQVDAESLAGTQFSISFASGPGGLTYSVASGTGAPGSAGFAATSGVVASGSYSVGSGLQFGGMDIGINGTPAAGDTFTVQPGSSKSIFQNVQDLIAALQLPQQTAAQAAYAQQQFQNVLTNLDGAQTAVLSAQGTLGSNLSAITAVQSQNQTLGTNAQVQLSNLQSANLPEVIARYSEALSSLQAAQLAFAKVQGLTLFSVIR